jgi:5-methylthioribose kinase
MCSTACGTQENFPLFFFATVHSFFTARFWNSKIASNIFFKYFSASWQHSNTSEIGAFWKSRISHLVYYWMTNEIKLSKWWKTPSAKAAFRRVAKEKRAKAKLLVARFAAAKAAKKRAMQID